MRVVDFLKQM